MKNIRRARRCKGDAALLEGPHLLREALDAGLALRSVLATPGFLDSAAFRELAPRLPRAPLAVEAKLLDEVADSDSPRGIVALVELPRRGIETLPVVPGGVYLYAEGVQDPGNLGALARSAEAAGAAALVLSPGCVHPAHPRALRASAGSLLRLPLAAGCPLDAVEKRLAPPEKRLAPPEKPSPEKRLAPPEKRLAPLLVALAADAARDLYATPLDGTVVLLVGAEGPGLSAETRARADVDVKIPLASPVESLNATVAAAVALFELRRRRAQPPAGTNET